MHSKALVGTGFAALAMTLTACGSGGSSGAGASHSMASSMSSHAAMASDSPMATHTSMTAMMSHGSFAGLNGKHVKGTATVDGDTVKLSGFSSDEGPDLHLYLTNGTDEAAVAKGTELGKVVFDKARQSFSLHGMSASKFTDVVVHCDKAKAVFGAAPLS